MQRRVFVAQAGESIYQVCCNLVPDAGISLAHQQGIYHLRTNECIQYRGASMGGLPSLTLPQDHAHTHSGLTL